MKLNKNSMSVLIAVLQSKQTSSEISEFLSLDVRTIQRSLSRLTSLGLIEKLGPANSPFYRPYLIQIIASSFDEAYFEDENRPETNFNFNLVDWLKSADEDTLIKLFGIPKLNLDARSPSISKKELEYLTIELSWKSSALEGNTYTLLDTELLVKDGLRAKGKTDFETQMILNHKNAIEFIIDNQDLFNTKFNLSTVENLHSIIIDGLGVEAGIRKGMVRISASNYLPIANQQKLKELLEDVINIINGKQNPILKALLALSLIPYLQAFEDGNKRTGRILANAILITAIGRGFSLRKIDAKTLAMAYIIFYEANSMLSLSNILVNELKT